MWFQVDEGALDDHRIAKLALRIDETYERAFFLCCRVWRLLYKRGGCVLAPEDIDAAARQSGFASDLLAADLAEACIGGVRLRGSDRAQQYAKTSDDQRHRAEVGWKTRRQRMPGQRPGNAPAVPGQSPGIESVSDATPNMPRHSPGYADQKTRRLKKVSTTVETPDLFGGRSSSQEQNAETVGSTSPRAGEARRVADHFHGRYAERAGRMPTWHGRHFANLKRLLERHGAEAVIGAIDVLFDRPPPFLARSMPDFDTLVQHFDKLALPAASGEALTSEQMRAAAAAMRAGGAQ